MRDESRNLMGFHEKSPGHRAGKDPGAGKDQGVAADFLGAVTEARAVHSHQMKCGGALSSDGMGSCWGSPLGGVVPQGMLGWMGSPCCPSCRPHQVFSTQGAAGGWGR